MEALTFALSQIVFLFLELGELSLFHEALTFALPSFELISLDMLAKMRFNVAAAVEREDGGHTVGLAPR